MFLKKFLFLFIALPILVIVEYSKYILLAVLVCLAVLFYTEKTKVTQFVCPAESLQQPEVILDPTVIQNIEQWLLDHTPKK